MALTYEPIATTTLGSAGQITFSSIPATYTDLRIVLIDTVPSAANPGLRFNGDTGSNYSGTVMSFTGASTVNSTQTLNSTAMYLQSQQASSTTIPTGVSIDIFSYAGTTWKTCLFTAFTELNGSGAIELGNGLYRVTTAITSILLFTVGGGNFSAGTSATLYGIKAA